MQCNAETVIQGLEQQGYFANKPIAYGVIGAIRDEGSPLLIEGDPGVGKTSLAQATASMLGVPLIRVSCYEGITPDRILYDYDYQRQLLIVTALREKLNDHVRDVGVREAVDLLVKDVDVYGKEFLLNRPVLRALAQPGKKVLLIDEIDKASEEIEHALLEVLSDFSITIPEYGTIRCQPDDRPVVFLTSNNYRELSDAMKRRCFYLHIQQKTYEEILSILMRKVEGDVFFLSRISKALAELQNASLKHPVSISEGIEWAKYLREVFNCQSGQDIVEAIPFTAGMLAKNSADIKRVQQVVSRVAGKDGA